MNLPMTSYSTPDVTEAAFYTAFKKCDFAAMERLWAEDNAICVHPGTDAILGYAAVLRSWAHIFAGAMQPDFQFNVVSRSVSETLVVHLVEEYISTGENTSAGVLATNVYKKYGDDWLMVSHHGSLVQAQVGARTLQ